MTDNEQSLPIHATVALDLRYVGQSHEITTPLLDIADPAEIEVAMNDFERLRQQLIERFHQLHQRQSGHALIGRSIEAVTLRLKLVCQSGVDHSLMITPTQTLATPLAVAGTYRPQQAEPFQLVRAALAAESVIGLPVEVYHRSQVQPGQRLSGPAIVLQLDATTIVPPGWQARCDSSGHLLLWH